MRSRSSSFSITAHRDILRRSKVVAHEVLKNDADIAAQYTQVVFAQIHAIEQDAAFVRIVETRQKFDERRLAGAVFAHQGQHLAGFEREAQMLTANRSAPGTENRRPRTEIPRGSPRGMDAAGRATDFRSISKNEKRSSR